MNENIPDIVLIYPSNFPDEEIAKEVTEFYSEKLNLKIQKNENEPFSAFEWILPTAFGVCILKPYFDSFLSEMGKDHYLILKNGLKKVLENGKKYKISLITATKSTEKLSNSYNQSLVISIIIQIKNNRQIKLLFDDNLSKDDWENAIEQLLVFVLENYEKYPNDKLSKRIEKLNIEERKMIYSKINPETKLIEFFDDNAMVYEFKMKNKNE